MSVTSRKSIRKYSVLVSIALVCLLPWQAATGETDEVVLEYVGSALWTGINDIERQGDYAYCTMPSGLVVLSLANPADPIEVGRLFLGGTCNGLGVDGLYACVATLEAGLHVVDISDPSALSLLGTWNSPELLGAVVVGDKAYCYGDNGLFLVDLSVPGAPAPLDDLGEQLEVMGLIVSGEYGYLTCGTQASDGLLVVDLSVPGVITELSRFEGLIRVHGLTMSGDYIYIASDFNGLTVFDVSDPASPQLTGSCVFPGPCCGRAKDVLVRGTYAYVADSTRGLAIVDVTDPQNPTWIVTYSPEPYPYYGPTDIAELGDLLVLNGNPTLLDILDISSPTAPVSHGQYQYPGFVRTVAVDGDVAWVVDGWGQLYRVDISVPVAPTAELYADLSVQGVIHELVIANGFACTAQRNGIAICDLSSPATPLWYGMTDRVGLAIAVQGNLMAVLGEHTSYGHGWLFTYDISNPLAPVELGEIDTWTWDGDLAISGDYVFVVQRNHAPDDRPIGSLVVVDVSAPEAPTIPFWTPSIGWSNDIEIQDQFAYIIASGLAVMDISVPSSPVQAGTADSWGEDLEVAGQLALVASEWFGLRTVDISRPDRPELIAEYRTPGITRQTAVEGDLICVADEYEFVILRVGLPDGICCLPDGSCVVADQTTCESTLDGTYGGITGECLGDNNGNGIDDGCEPTGACCFDAYQCVVTNQLDCEVFLGGVYHGDDTECSGDPNGNGEDDFCEPVGACCTEWNGCQILNQTNCESPYWGGVGVYAGDDTECIGDLDENGIDDVCENQGACCHGEYDCQVTTYRYCHNYLVGHYAGDGETCVGDSNDDGFDDTCVPLTCCEGRVGDANGIGGDEPSIGDVSVMIDARFITGSCEGIIACLAEADINQSGGPAPTCDDVSIGDIAYLIDYLFITGRDLGLNDCF